MGIREKLREKSGLSTAIAGGVVLVAAIILLHTYWPDKKANLALAYYTDDDGKTWFTDSAYLVAPFQHDGKTAVVAEVYTYSDGKKQFCAYVAQFTPEAKKRLETALVEAQKNGQPPNSISLYHDPGFAKQGMLVKPALSNDPWIAYGDRRAQTIFTIHSPDGSEADQAFVY